jgi:ribosomal-protein-alanine N-acetyltransferase
MSAQGTKMQTSAPFQLRDYRPSDFERLCEIDRQCFPPAIACAARELDETAREPSSFAIIGEADGGAVAGFIIASMPRGNTGHIVTLDVVPEFRRQGLGEKLLRAAEDRLLALKVDRIVLETPMASGGAQALYRKLGFVRVGYVKGYYSDGTDAWLMEKQPPKD